MPKIEKLFSKIVMIIFLVLLILGFTVPGFINNQGNSGNQPAAAAEQRLCKSDADCYLTCENQPVPIICLQNLCQQNECGDSYFAYEPENPVTFKLEVIIDSFPEKKVSLIDRTNSQNFFVKFMENDLVQMYSPRLSLNAVLDKAQMVLANNCLKIDAAAYCSNTGSNAGSNTDNYLTVLVNGEEAADPGIYIPNEGDEIIIKYGARNLK